MFAGLVAFGAASCADTTGDQGGLDMRSRGVGERDERLGNDPSEQNTGEGSTTSEGPTSQEEPQSNPE
jgi:hypothetical protein